MPIVAFDLDGTISDPAEGITNAINYTLVKLCQKQKKQEELLQFIGPPLNEIFAKLLKTKEKSILEEAISFYREHYFSIGYKENKLYPKIKLALQQLTQSNFSLYLATSKRGDIAKMIINHFNLTDYFKGIYGCGLYKEKGSLLEEILSESAEKSLIMVGDRSHDMIAGKSVAAKCIGVLWGYGDANELKQAGADIIVKTPEEMLNSII